MTFRNELTTLDRLFYTNDINEDTLLYILSRKRSILDLEEIWNDQNIDNIKQEKILTTISALCDKGYAKERLDKKSVSITLKGHWHRTTHDSTFQFLAAIAGIIAVIITIWQLVK